MAGRNKGKRGGENLIVVRMIPLLNAVELRPKIGATKSSVNYHAFTRAVDFHSEEMAPWESESKVDLRATHVRNKWIKDLPFTYPRCCTDIFNQMRDKRNARKLRKFGLDKEVRQIVRGREPERSEPCLAEQEGEDNEEEERFVQVPECYIVDRDSCSSSDEEEPPRRSESECSGCSTLGTGFKKIIRKTEKVDFHEILQRIPLDPCDLIKGKNFRKV